MPSRICSNNDTWSVGFGALRSGCGMTSSHVGEEDLAPILEARELAAVNALLDGARTALEVDSAIGGEGWATLRAMELREPSLVTSRFDRAAGEVWAATTLGVRSAAASARQKRPGRS